MRVAVTGGTGFIGSHLVEALAARGDSVRILTREKTSVLNGVPAKANSSTSNLEYFFCSYDTVDSIAKAISGCDWVIHLAASLRATQQDRLPAINRTITKNLISAIQDTTPATKLLVCSSQAAAGPVRSGVPVSDSDLANPISWYGKSKRAQEEALLESGDNLWWTVLRPPAVFGPREKDIFVFFKALSRGWSIRIGSVKRQFSWIYVSDFIAAILTAMNTSELKSRICFVKSGDTDWDEFRSEAALAMQTKYRVLTLPEVVAKTFAVVSETAAIFTGNPALLNRDKILELSYPDWRCDDANFRSLAGFTKRTSLPEALRETLQWYRAEKWL